MGHLQHLAATALLAVSLLPCAPSAGAQGREHFPGQDAVRFNWTPSGGGGKGFIRLRTTGLPEKTNVLLQLRLDGGDIEGSWTRYYLGSSGSLVMPLGPFTKELLPGSYAVVLTVDPIQQDASLNSHFSSWGRTRVVKTYKWAYKGADEATTREQHRLATVAINDGFIALLDETLDISAGYPKKTSWHRNGKFDAKEFLAWADASEKRVTRLRAELDSMRTKYLCPYWPRIIRQDLKQIAEMIRLVVIDYTIHPILQRERLSVEKRYEPLKAMMKPSRVSAIERARMLARDIKSTLRAPGDEPSSPLLQMFPTKVDLPAGFEIQPATLGVVSANPGALKPVAQDGLDKINARLNIRLNAADIAEIGILELQPSDGKQGEPPVIVYLFRYDREVYSVLCAQQMLRRRTKHSWPGLIYKKDGLVAVIDGSDKPPHKAGVVAMANRLVSKHGFTEVVARTRRPRRR